MTAAHTRRTRWLFTCEHGGHDIPPELQHAFSDAADELASHRGWDSGALQAFEALAAAHADAAFCATTSRLLVDLNRSLHHPQVFSRHVRGLSAASRADIAARWWQPWRESVAATIEQWLAAGAQVRHVSVHSFTPVLGMEVRNADIGLLYDPARSAEARFCRAWQGRLRSRDWRVRRNYPYRGAADGHTTALRKRFGPGYLGVELELNQALFPQREAKLLRDLVDTLPGD
jgi:predicted N-formylglutamate amidohydrolase